MPSTPEQRQKVELQRCLESFEGQFREWRARVELPEWGTHYSQVHAATRLLEGLRDGLKTTLDSGKDSAGKSADLSLLEPLVLSAWRVWEAFRSRLSQRQEEMFRAGLQAADELAWCVRKPFADLLGSALPKEPALCYLNGAVSPTALVRGVPFAEEAVRGEGVHVEARKLLESLPVPLISLPWTEVFHAPSMVSIAHETGHVLEVDAKLEGALPGVIAKAADDSNWKPWAKEIFADHIAMRACGRGFAVFLADLLAPLKKRGVRPMPAYPDYDTRMELCFAALADMGHAQQAGELRQEWKNMSGTVKSSPLADAVVKALAKMKVSGQNLSDVITFNSDHESAVLRIMRDLRQNPARVSEQPATHIAAAAACLFHEEPEYFDDLARTQDIQQVMLRAAGPSSRRRAGRRVDLRLRSMPAAKNAAVADAAFEAHFQQGANLLLDLLKQRRRASSKPKPSASKS